VLCVIVLLCKCYWIVLYTVHVTAFCLGRPFFTDTVHFPCVLVY